METGRGNFYGGTGSGERRALVIGSRYGLDLKPVTDTRGRRRAASPLRKTIDHLLKGQVASFRRFAPI